MHGALLRQCRFQRGHDFGGRAGGPTHGVQHAANGQVTAQAGFERRRRHALRHQHLAIAFGREAAVVLELRNGGDGVAQRFVGHREAVVDGNIGKQPLVDQLVQQVFAQGGRVNDGGVEASALALLDLRQLVAMRLIKLGARNRLAGDRRQLRLLAHEAVIALNSDEEEGRHNQKQQDELHPAPMAAN
ncbi:hypothetical protein D3C73_1182030 [compost metagenome]